MRNRFIKTFLALSAVFSFSAGLYSCGGESSSEISGDSSYISEYISENSTTASESPEASTGHVHPLTHLEFKKATCEEDGHMSCWYCEECGKYFANEEGTVELDESKAIFKATGHDWNTNSIKWTWDGFEAATATFTCKNDSSHTTVLDASIISEVTTEPTCSANGVRTYTATVEFDGTSYITRKTEQVPAYDHTLIHVERVEPSCEDGNIEYWYCEECGTLFSDEEGTNEISVLDSLIDATHNYGTDGICTDCGAHKPTEGISYSFDSSTNTYAVAGIGDATDTELYFPERYDDGTNGKHEITSIAASAFSAETSITSVTMPDSITSIGASAFYKCTGITSVDLGSGVTSIGDNAFNNCTKLTGIDLPDSLKELGSSAFYYCTKLASIVIPEKVTSIGDDTFYWCTKLASVTLSDNITSIGEQAFHYCTSLSDIELPSKLASIGKWAFWDCDLIKSITIPASVTYISNRAFYGCTSLTSVTFEKTTGWYVSKSSTASSGTNLTLDDPATNATYLTDTYYTYYWFRK